MILSRLLRMWDSLGTYPQTHVHREVEPYTYETAVTESAVWAGVPVSALCWCRRCGWMGVR